MSRKWIPEDLRQEIRNSKEKTWEQTRGMNEQDFFENLSKDLHTKIKKTLCEKLVKKVPILKGLDSKFLEKVYMELKSTYEPKRTCLLREEDRIEYAFFIVNGKLLVSSSQVLNINDHIGGEIFDLIDPNFSRKNLISKSRVQAITDVEGYKISYEEVKTLVSEYEIWHGPLYKRIQGARSIQKAWRRYVDARAAIPERVLDVRIGVPGLHDID